MKLPSHEKFSAIGKKILEVLQNQDGLFPPSLPQPWPQTTFVNGALSLQAERNSSKAFAEGNKGLAIDLQIKQLTIVL